MVLSFIKSAWRKYAATHVVFIVTWSCFVITPDVSAQEPETALNIHYQGGLLKNWLVMGPLYLPRDEDSIPNGAQEQEAIDRVIASFDFDFLVPLGGEDSVVITRKSAITDTVAGIARDMRAQEFVAGADGIVSLDSLFTPDSLGVAYAFCLVEAYIPCKIRCVWGVDGSSKVWVNGNVCYNAWDYADSCVPLSKYFDAEFVQGMNRLLIKLTNEKAHSRFRAETWDLRDSLKPFIRDIHAISIELKKSEIKNRGDSISACLQFNIAVPEHVFKAEVAVFPDQLTAYAEKKTSRFEVLVGKSFSVGIPGGGAGVYGVSASAVVKENRIMQAARYIWSGDFAASLRSAYDRLGLLELALKGYAARNALDDLVVHGAYQWIKDWYTIADSLPVDQKIRQLGYVRSNGDLVESLIKGKRLRGDCSVPLYIQAGTVQPGKWSEEYDPSHWLNYKYPDLFALPRDIKGSTDYRLWVYLPRSAQRQRNRMPLILALHDIDACGYDIDKVRRFGPAAYAGSVSRFPFAVVSPQCRFGTLWDAGALKTMFDTLVATRRFDKKRVSITGSGMGAFAAYFLASLFPEEFAAVAAINGGGEWDNVCRLKNLPLWVFHGEKDTLVPVEKAHEIVSLLKECGKKNVEVSVYTDYGHHLSPVVYGDARLYAWLKKQKR